MMDNSSSSGFNVLDRKTSLNRMKSTGTGSTISIMPAHHHQQTNPDRPFTLGDGGGGTAGPIEAALGGYKYPAGGGVAAGFPFTGAQWKELERQAMIYKCMISCVPVPPHLLFPCDRYSRKGDPEPGRCKRTDGKKWRCSREVAPQQKYCERHLHRGRPRSRKPVEPNNNNNNKKTGLQQTKTPPNNLLKPKTNTITYYKETNSLFDAASSKQPWGDFGQDYPLLQEEEAPLNLFSYPEMDLAAGFIDVESEGDLSPCLDLSMAMAVGNVLDQQMRNIDDDFDATKWLSPVSWEPFARGGPLAEALQPGSPSGVLHRTLFSHSDGSVCNSPTGTFWV